LENAIAPTREDGLKELAEELSAAISKARQLNLSTCAYILSMALLEITEVLKQEEERSGRASRDRP
jgi:hypothetical protein